MQRLDCIGGKDHFADAWRKGKERGDVLPGSAPGRPNRRVAFAPLGLDQANELLREKEGAKILGSATAATVSASRLFARAKGFTGAGNAAPPKIYRRVAAYGRARPYIGAKVL
jgi:hypothetical protein